MGLLEDRVLLHAVSVIAEKGFHRRKQAEGSLMASYVSIAKPCLPIETKAMGITVALLLSPRQMLLNEFDHLHRRAFNHRNAIFIENDMFVRCFCCRHCGSACLFEK